MSNMDDINKGLREAVAARLAAKAESEASLPDDIPAAYLERVKGFELKPAVPAEVPKPEPQLLGATMPQEALEAAWAGIRSRREDMLARIKAGPAAPPVASEVVWQRPRIVGISGKAGAGKNTVAAAVPGAVVIGFADPLYAGLSAMLGVPEAVLRDRNVKDRLIPWLGKSPRQLLQTLGHEWGRGMVATDLWLRLCERRIDALLADGVETVCIADVRYDNEANLIRERLGVVWHVRRDTAGTDEHASEAGIQARDGDWVVSNEGTIDEIHAKVREYLNARTIEAGGAAA